MDKSLKRPGGRLGTKEKSHNRRNLNNILLFLVADSIFWWN
jgi:hypothetical protein